MISGKLGAMASGTAQEQRFFIDPPVFSPKPLPYSWPIMILGVGIYTEILSAPATGRGRSGPEPGHSQRGIQRGEQRGRLIT